MNQSYSTCAYSQCDYYTAFRVVAPLIKQAFPTMLIHANSARGQAGASPVANDDVASSYVDMWTWHYVGGDRSIPMTSASSLLAGSRGKPIINNEYEYQPDQSIAGTPQSTLNTAQIILNFFTFTNSPAFYWIHALKPTTNDESKGYGLGFWRPRSDQNQSHFPDVKTGEWTYAPINYHAVAGFAKIMPWDSVRYDVTEETVEPDARIMVFKTPEGTLTHGHGGPLHAYRTPPGKIGLVLAYGRDAKPGVNFTYTVAFDDNQAHTLNGYRFTPDASGYNVSLGSKTWSAGGAGIDITVPPLAIEFWVEW